MDNLNLNKPWFQSIIFLGKPGSFMLKKLERTATLAFFSSSTWSAMAVANFPIQSGRDLKVEMRTYHKDPQSTL